MNEQIKKDNDYSDNVSQAEKDKIKKSNTGAKELKINENGNLVVKNLEQQYRLAQFFVKSGMLPKQYTTPEKVITGMQYAKELGLPPMIGLRQIALVAGTPSIFGDLPLALVKKSQKLEYINEILYDEDFNEISIKNKNLSAPIFAAECIIKRKGDVYEIKKQFTMEDAKDANLLIKDNWKFYPKIMLKYKARSMAIKDAFPDILNGIAITEYDEHELPEQSEHIKPISNEKKELLHAIEYKIEKLKYNEAKQLQLINKFLKVEHPRNAEIKNLKILNNELDKIIKEKENESI